MKVWNLRCAHGHGFEGWFASEEDYVRQQEQGLLSCPLCGEAQVVRSPSAPRLNLSGAREMISPTGATPPAATASTGGAASVTGETAVHPTSEQMQRIFLQAVRSVMASTEDVGERFPEEARRIHLGEAPSRGIRGQATPEEREELRDEGIEVFSLPVPEALKGPTH
ncbi:DUF1178 family protein [Ideonella sp. B7]|uniref:DUF1178 family protein n=1 Tax=Ideonella benzenivorans TaxID=2831643 RepID=UPI001CED9E16|nr:DUF1178 family protein [Ideonella benzenivorans]MCA6217399.1 DUF1178 family protein [Ideonella benzenivorans]